MEVAAPDVPNKKPENVLKYKSVNLKVIGAKGKHTTTES